MQGYVYILKDDNNRFYVGSTRNLERRVKQHSQGLSKFTASMKNPRLVLQQTFESITIARKVENRIKKLKRKDYIEKMVTDGYLRIKID